MSGRVLLLRHPPVAGTWAGRCYGRSDMGLGRAGAAMARAIVADIAGRGVTAVVHSDMRRTRPLAAAIARTAGCPAIADPRWRERDFGGWEGRRWHSIWRETGDAMDRMMTDPAGFRPGGGETGADIATRAAAAWHDLPRGGVTVVVAHGGSIAAARAWLAGDPLERMVAHIPACGAIVEVARD
ncbi:histidine phosphatase family protein [Sphingomonas bacterium]|uniref:histidine phosphatase family protein n=1 Tax=Sphingomonas bacterium TaxID=1895847 RepID=UPI00157768E9|nr:histidine phosphatase family protein [Sphingomonas bacterium]